MTITVRGARLRIEVADDGRGGAAENSGLANLRHPAERCGGTFDMESEVGEGTRLSWQIPLR